MVVLLDLLVLGRAHRVVLLDLLKMLLALPLTSTPCYIQYMIGVMDTQACVPLLLGLMPASLSTYALFKAHDRPVIS